MCVCVCVFDVGEEKERRVLGVEMAFVSGHMHRCLNTCAPAHTKSSLANVLGLGLYCDYIYVVSILVKGMTYRIGSIMGSYQKECFLHIHS